MRTPGSRKTRAGCVILALKLLAVPVFLYLFLDELLLLRDLLRFLTATDKTNILPPQQEWSVQLIVFLAGLFVVFALTFIILYLIAGAIFPLKSGKDQMSMLWRMVDFFFGDRRPVLVVRDGRHQLDSPNRKEYSGGVALVDASSAVILEDVRRSDRKVRSAGAFFIRRGEKMVGVVSLRRQSRGASAVKVLTADGIELTTSVNATFTLGEEPDVLKVAYVRDPQAGDEDGLPSDDLLREQAYLNLRVARLEWDDEGGARIKALTDDLDQDDKMEIHQFAQRYRLRLLPRATALAPDSAPRKFPPYQLDEARILAAVRASARRLQDDAMELWSDYPVSVAVAALRDQIAGFRYDELYTPGEFNVSMSIRENPTRFPLAEIIKPAFANHIKRQGVLAYQFILPISGEPVEVGMRVDRSTFRLAPAQTLIGSKILRDLGIKVISAGFGDLEPSPEMREQRVEHWAVRWQQDVTENELARRQAYAERIKAEAHAQRHTALISRMLQILGEPNPDTLVMNSIVHLLEDISQEEATRHKLPPDTLSLMEKFKTMTLPPPRP